MARKKKDLFGLLGMLVTFLVTLAIGGGFVSGIFSGVFLLNYLPSLVMTIVGYLIIAGGFLGLYNYFK